MDKVHVLHKTAEKGGLRFLFLTLDIWRQTGGIQQMNKLISLVLSNIALQTAESTLYLYSLHDDPARHAISTPPLCSTYTAFAGNRYRFFRDCLRTLPEIEILLLSHIHLLPIAMLLSLGKPKLRIIMLAHGVEVRGPLSCLKAAFLRKKTELWAVSAFTAQCLSSRLGNMKRIEVLNNALSPDFVLPHRFGKPRSLLLKHLLSDEHKVLLTVCRVNRHAQDKGIEQVLRSLPPLLLLFPKICYLIVGVAETEEKQRLEDIADQLKIRSCVTFLHFISAVELTNYYLLADVFIMPSKREGFGLSFIEAAACGCRIIAGNTDGSTDALLNGKLGIMVDPDDLYQIKSAIVWCLNHPYAPTQAKRIHDLCLKHFSIPAYQSKVQNLLDAPNVASKIS